MALFRDWLATQSSPHWREFAAAWSAPEGKQGSLL
jgi:hypothetical protein